MMPPLVTVVLAFTFLQAPPAAQAPDQRAHAAAVIAAMAAKDFAKVEDQFDDKMKAALPPGRLAATWESLTTQAGAFKGCGADVRVRAIADKYMVITPCEFARVTLDLQLAFDTAGHISGLVFRAAASAAPYTPPAYAIPSS